MGMESVVCKFPFSDGTRQVQDFSVGQVDGQTKILLMFAITSFCCELDLKLEDLGPLAFTLRTFQYIRCSYAFPPLFEFLGPLGCNF